MILIASTFFFEPAMMAKSERMTSNEDYLCQVVVVTSKIFLISRRDYVRYMASVSACIVKRLERLGAGSFWQDTMMSFSQPNILGDDSIPDAFCCLPSLVFVFLSLP